jgi:undecaprenyl diphosphate synthase
LSKSKTNAESHLLEQLKKSGEIPRHIAIIMDGNGRWAKSKGLPRFAGHRVGVDSVRDIVKACAELGVKYLTLYTFSTENWNRPKEEVSTLMKLLLKTLRKEIDDLHKNNVRLFAVGDLKSLPEAVQQQLYESVEKTKNNEKLNLILALNYGGRWEIIEAVKQIVKDAKKDLVNLKDIDDELINSYLTTKNIPDPDLLIRTSGEFRISNFLLWQIAYTEFVISDVYWPDFRKEQLFNAVKQFQKRERRFGKVSEQII